MKIRSLVHILRPLERMLFLCLILCSCNDEDIEGPEENPEEQGIPVETVDSLAYESLLDIIAPKIVDEAGNVKIDEPRFGTAIDASHPDEYYTTAKSAEDALNKFESLFVRDKQAGTFVRTDKEASYSLYHGNLICKAENNDGIVATVTFDIPETPHVKKLHYCQEEYWPLNGPDRSSPFSRLQIWKSPKGGVFGLLNGSYYFICVRDCYSGQKGLLVTFDALSESNIYTLKNGGHKLTTDCASWEAWDAIIDIAQNQNNKLKKTIESFGKQLTSSEKNGPYYCMTYKMLSHIANGSVGNWEKCGHERGWDGNNASEEKTKYTYKVYNWLGFSYDLEIPNHGFTVGWLNEKQYLFWFQYYHYVRINTVVWKNGHLEHLYHDFDSRLDKVPLLMPSREIVFDYDFNRNGWELVAK